MDTPLAPLTPTDDDDDCKVAVPPFALMVKGPLSVLITPAPVELDVSITPVEPETEAVPDMLLINTFPEDEVIDRLVAALTDT